jgi:2-dehydropantoate 2-reductase
MSSKPNVIIIGAGGMGGFYGGKLAQAGAQVSVICRSNFAEVKKNGITLRSDKDGFHFKPHAVYAHDQRIDETFDYVILATKVSPEADITNMMQQLLKPETKIVLLQNGIDIEDPIRKAFPHHLLISAVTYIAVYQKEAGTIIYDSAEKSKIILGMYPQSTMEHCKELQALWLQSGLNCTVVDDIIQKRWEKLVWNAAMNPITVLGGRRFISFIGNNPTGRQLARDVMTEVSKIAAASGYVIDESLIDDYLEKSRQASEIETSMLQDFDAKKSMEYEAILGNTIKVAHRHNIPAPRLETLYGLLKLIDTALA